MWQTARDPLQGGLLCLREMALDKEKAMLEQVGDFLLQSLAFLDQLALVRLGTSTSQFGLPGG